MVRPPTLLVTLYRGPLTLDATQLDVEADKLQPSRSRSTCAASSFFKTLWHGAQGTEHGNLNWYHTGSYGFYGITNRALSIL